MAKKKTQNQDKGKQSKSYKAKSSGKASAPKKQAVHVKKSREEAKPKEPKPKHEVPQGPSIQFNTSGGNRTQKMIFAFAPFILAFAYLTFVWSTPEERVTDDWYAAFELVQESFQEKDPDKSRQLLDSGGTWLRELVWKYPKHARVHYFTGIYFAIKGQLDSAIWHQKVAIHYGKGAIVNQVDHAAREELARASSIYTQQLMQRGQLDQARTMLWESLHYAPNSHDILNNLGIISNNIGRTDSAVYYLDKSLAVKPDQPDIRKNFSFACANYGNRLMEQGSYEQAAELYRKAVAHIKDDPALYANLGRANMLLGQREKARENFNRALKLNPNHAFSLRYLNELQ